MNKLTDHQYHAFRDGTASDIDEDDLGFEQSFEFDVCDMLKGICGALACAAVIGMLCYAILELAQ